MFKKAAARKSLWCIVAIFVILLILPRVLPRFYIYILALIFVNALLATSLNLVLGYGGIFQFHHCVFYGMGAYAFALLLTKTSLPMWLGFIAGPIAAAVLGLIISLFCVRLSKIYYGMLQISLGSLVWAVVHRWYSFTGGDDGIHGIAMPAILSSEANSYYFILIVTAVCLLIMYVILRSPFGSTLQAIRDNPARCAAAGIDTRRQQLTALVIATFFAGVAGVLFVVLEHSVFPSLLFWSGSLETIILCLLGGWHTFLGPSLGAAIVVVLRTFVGSYTEYWALILGVMMVLLIFFLPQGVLGYFMERFKPQVRKAERSINAITSGGSR